MLTSSQTSQSTNSHIMKAPTLSQIFSFSKCFLSLSQSFNRDHVHTYKFCKPSHKPYKSSSKPSLKCSLLSWSLSLRQSLSLSTLTLSALCRPLNLSQFLKLSLSHLSPPSDTTLCSRALPHGGERERREWTLGLNIRKKNPIPFPPQE